jgi:hypothetical protein
MQPVGRIVRSRPDRWSRRSRPYFHMTAFGLRSRGRTALRFRMSGILSRMTMRSIVRLRGMWPRRFPVTSGCASHTGRGPPDGTAAPSRCARLANGRNRTSHAVSTKRASGGSSDNQRALGEAGQCFAANEIVWCICRPAFRAGPPPAAPVPPNRNLLQHVAKPENRSDGMSHAQNSLMRAVSAAAAARNQRARWQAQQPKETPRLSREQVWYRAHGKGKFTYAHASGTPPRASGVLAGRNWYG